MTEDARRKRIIAGVVIVTAILFISFGWYLFRITKVEFGFSKVKVGDNKESVINMMGQPSKNVLCDSSIRQKHKDVVCHEISAYYSLLSYWAIAFDENGKVIKKYYWTFDDGYGKPDEIDMLF